VLFMLDRPRCRSTVQRKTSGWPSGAFGVRIGASSRDIRLKDRSADPVIADLRLGDHGAAQVIILLACA